MKIIKNYNRLEKRGRRYPWGYSTPLYGDKSSINLLKWKYSSKTSYDEKEGKVGLIHTKVLSGL